VARRESAVDTTMAYPTQRSAKGGGAGGMGKGGSEKENKATKEPKAAKSNKAGGMKTSPTAAARRESAVDTTMAYPTQRSAKGGGVGGMSKGGSEKENKATKEPKAAKSNNAGDEDIADGSTNRSNGATHSVFECPGSGSVPGVRSAQLDPAFIRQRT